MLLHSPFNFPYLFKPNYRYNYYPQYIKRPVNNNYKLQKSPINKFEETKQEDSNSKPNTSSDESSKYFFEIFGLKLYFDDVIIMCLLYFLYTEGVQDKELFLCLILLLLS